MAVPGLVGPFLRLSHAGGQVGAEPICLNAGVVWQAPGLGFLLESPPILQTPPAHVSGRVPSLSAAWALLSIRPAGLDVQTQSAGTPGKGPAWLAGPPYSWALVSSQGCCGAAPRGCGAGPGTPLPSAARSARGCVLEAGFALSVLFPGRRSWDSSRPHPSLCPPVLSQAGRGSPSRARGQPVLAEGGQAGSPGAGRRSGGPPRPFRGVSGWGGGQAAPPCPPSWCLDSRPGHSRGGPGPGLPPLAEQRVPGACWGSRLL